MRVSRGTPGFLDRTPGLAFPAPAGREPHLKTARIGDSKPPPVFRRLQCLRECRIRLIGLYLLTWGIGRRANGTQAHAGQLLSPPAERIDDWTRRTSSARN